MAAAVIETAQSYVTTTSDATPTSLLHLVPRETDVDWWGHWTVRCTARKVGTGSCAHFYQRVSGIWTVAAGMVFTGTQPAMESEKAAAMAACTFSVTNSDIDNLVLNFTGIAATTINWFCTVVNHNIYSEDAP
jgi:hypothetical protein